MVIFSETNFTNEIHEAEGNVKEIWSTINELIKKIENDENTIFKGQWNFHLPFKGNC